MQQSQYVSIYWNSSNTVSKNHVIKIESFYDFIPSKTKLSSKTNFRRALILLHFSASFSGNYIASFGNKTNLNCAALNQARAPSYTSFKDNIHKTLINRHPLKSLLTPPRRTHAFARGDFRKDNFERAPQTALRAYLCSELYESAPNGGPLMVSCGYF